MTPIEPIVSPTLEAALEFSPDDLAANRAGTLSARQRARLDRAWHRQRALAIGAGIALVFISALCLYLGRRGDIVFTAMGLAFTGLLAALIGIATQAAIRYQRDTLRPVLAQTTAVERVLRIVGGTYLYVARIGAGAGRHEDIRVTKQVFNAFSEDTAYRLYRAAGSGALLSAERDAR
jgi:hypothetical protein